MNSINEIIIRSPNDIEEKCAQFIVDDATVPFVFHDVAKEGQEYTFSSYMRSDKSGAIEIEGQMLSTETDWERQFITFGSSGSDVELYFNEVGTYYLFETQLEIGNTMTDWRPAVEDTEADIDDTNNRFEEYVTITELNSSIEASASEINASVSAVRTSVDELDLRVESTEAKLELKVDSSTLISEINASADVITLNGNRFIVNSDNLKIAEDGSIHALNGTFSGEITAVEGEIGGFIIDDDELIGKEKTILIDSRIGYMRIVGGASSSDGDNEWYPVAEFMGGCLTLGAMSTPDVTNDIETNKYPHISLTHDYISGRYANGKSWFSLDGLNGRFYLNNVLVQGNALTHKDEIGQVLLTQDNSHYFFRPYEASMVINGSVGYPWYKTYTERLEVTVDRIICKPSYEKTTTSSSNLNVNSSGAFSRSTGESSRTIKHDIENLGYDESLDAKKLYNLEVVQFKYNDGIITDVEDARYQKDLPGFIIENMDEIYPIAIDKPSDNVREWSWNSRYLIPPMVKLLQEHKKQINELETGMYSWRPSVESRMEYLQERMDEIYEILMEQQTIIKAMA